MTKRKRFILYPILALLLFYSAWTQTRAFVVDVKYHNSNHAPCVNGVTMKESDGYFFYQDSTSKKGRTLCYYVKSSYIQQNCQCRICEKKESLLVKAGIATKIIKENNHVPREVGQEVPIASNFGVTVSHN